MSTNTAVNERGLISLRAGLSFPLASVGCALRRLPVALALLLAVMALPARAGMEMSAWTPLFKGIDYAEGTNTPGSGSISLLQVVRTLRVDLSDPDIQLFSTPRLDNYLVGSREAAGMTVSDFVKTYHVQVAINASEFTPEQYYLKSGTAMNIRGLGISQGVVVSEQDTDEAAAVLMVTSNNVARFVFTNWPPVSTEGVYTAVAGRYPVLVNGVNIGARYGHSGVHGLNPRTAVGLSADRRFLYLMTIDGRQSGYSEGAYDEHTAAWLLLAGAADGINMDGGGSATMAMEDSTGNPQRLNHPSSLNDRGLERTVGSHFAVFAKPAPGFINDLRITPDDTTASVSWTTVEPASAQVQFGRASSLGSSSELQSDLSTQHVAQIAGLTPNTGYYVQAVSGTATGRYTSPIRYFVTKSYAQTNLLFDLTQTWSYNTANLDGANWTAPSYDDSAWPGSGPGLLWVDVRSTGPLEEVQPKNTQMPANPNNAGYPFTTYYFRTHFSFTNSTAGVSLIFSNYLDDGGVFYLNGVEVYRLRMAAAPTVLRNSTLAEDYGCDGDATCPDVFTLTADQTSPLVRGDNVLAVEVHNYNVRSADATFGLALLYAAPDVPVPTLTVAYEIGAVTLSWSGAGFTLQEADSPAGPWTAVTKSVATSPYKISITGDSRFFRLVR